MTADILLAQIQSDIEKTAPEFASFNWDNEGRPEQHPPTVPWWIWIIMAGRGWGKNRTGAEWIRRKVREMPGSRGALVARTAADVRDTMVHNPGSGLMSVFLPSERPTYQPSRRRLVWPNGTIGVTYTADKPDQMRGPQQHWGWGDEVSTWRYQEALDNLLTGTRLQYEHPRTKATTSPEILLTFTPRPNAIVKKLLEQQNTVITYGAMLDNASNLDPKWVEMMTARYAGTRWAAQELEGQLLTDLEGALWTYSILDETRVSPRDVCTGDHDDDIERIVCNARVHIVVSWVSVDPGGSGPENDPTGLAVVGRGDDGEYYGIEALAVRMSPNGWAREAIALLDRYNAVRIVAEKNHGGEMVEATIRNVRRNVPIKVIHAKKGKRLRAEPVSALFEQGRAHMIGRLSAVEDQMTAFTGDEQKDTDPTDPNAHFDVLDAVVYGFLEASGNSGGVLEIY